MSSQFWVLTVVCTWRIEEECLGLSIYIYIHVLIESRIIIQNIEIDRPFGYI